jgi:hypothetical protein
MRSLEKRLERGLLHPIDYLRRRRTRGALQVDAAEREVRRGGELDARVTIASPGGVGEVEVGLVCTEFYACHVSGSDGRRSRGTSSATAHEEWLPVEDTPGLHSVRLTVPAEAPFSYEGELLCFTWEVVARGRRKHRLDAQARHEISVLP